MIIAKNQEVFQRQFISSVPVLSSIIKMIPLNDVVNTYEGQQKHWEDIMILKVWEMFGVPFYNRRVI